MLSARPATGCDPKKVKEIVSAFQIKKTHNFLDHSFRYKAKFGGLRLN